MVTSHLAPLIDEILYTPPAYTLDFRWDVKYGAFSVLIGIVHVPKISPAQSTCDLLTSVALCDQAFAFIHGPDRPATLALPDVRTLRVLCSTARLKTADGAPAKPTIAETFLVPIDAAVAKERERKNDLAYDPYTANTDVPNTFAHVPFAELRALVAVFPKLRNMVLSGVIADTSAQGLRRPATPPWCPAVDDDGDVTMDSASQTLPLVPLDTLVIDLSLDLTASGMWTTFGMQPGPFTITEALAPLALSTQINTLVLRNVGPIVSPAPTVEPIASASSVKHLHLKGEHGCRNVLPEFLRLLGGKHEAVRPLETLEVAKLYAVDLAVIRTFVGHAAGQHLKRMIFELVDDDHKFLEIDKDFSFLVSPDLEELSLRVTPHRKALCPKPLQLSNACGWALLHHALDALSHALPGDARRPDKLLTIHLEFAWRAADVRDRVKITALYGDHLPRAAGLIDRLLARLPALSYVRIYALWPDGLPYGAELPSQGVLFPKLMNMRLLTTQPMESMHWNRPWAPWI